MSSSPLKRAAYRKLNADQRHAYDKAWRLALKIEVFSHYGGLKCLLCSEKRIGALTLDHIAQDGAQHKASIGITTGPIYRWIKNNHFPPGFRVLCVNCNILAYLQFTHNRPLSTNKDTVWRRQKSKKSKSIIMEQLGNKCRECNISDLRVLTINHISNNGADHRRRVSFGRGSAQFYNAMLCESSLQGLECLCFSCNCNLAWT